MSDELIPGLRAFLLADGAVSAACRGVVRAFALQAEPVGISYYIAGASSQPTMDQRGPQRRRVHFDCRASSIGQAAAIRSALADLLDGFQGEFPGGLYLTLVEFLTEIDFFDDQAREYRAGIEFYFHFNL